LSARPRVPRLAARLVSLCVPERDRASLLGDLQERFARRASTGGPASARRWYWRQTFGVVLTLGPGRIFHAVTRFAAPGTARAAARSLLRSPGSSLACAATLAIGIAAPLAMFSLADGVTSSLPGDPDDRVVRVSWIPPSGGVRVSFPAPAVEVFQSGAAGPDQPLTVLAALGSSGRVAVGDGEQPAGRYWGVYATADMFDLLEVTPIIGRVYSEAERGGLPAAVIREDVWEERFDTDPSALGSVLRVDGVDHVVVGVLPRSFGFPNDHRIWMQPTEEDVGSWALVGRLAPAASPALARAHLASFQAAAGAARTDEPQVLPELHVERYTTAHFANDGGDETSRAIGMLSLVLVILTGANVAAVMVARGVARSREVAVRMALGSSRAQIMALTLTEALFLAVAGGALGVLLGHGGMQVMVRYLSSQATIVPYWMDFELGIRSVVLGGLLSLLALAAAGLIPAIRTSRTSLDGALRIQSGGGRRGGVRLMSFVVGTEVALACFLLALSSAVIEQGLTNLRTGAAFPTEAIMTGNLALEPPAYPDEEARRAQFARVLEALRADPAVDGAALASELPGKEGAIRPAGPVSGDADVERLPAAHVRAVSDGFFELMALSASAGRLLSAADRASTEPVAVVNDAFARRHRLGPDVVGRRIVVNELTAGEPYEATVVGVVDDRGVTPWAAGRPAPGVYLSADQLTPSDVYVMLRVRENVAIPALWHDAVRPIDPYLPLGSVLSLEETLRRGHGAETLFTSVFIALGCMTLLVVLVGVHGVHAFSMGRRARELGVRRALGASTARVIRDGARRGLRPAWIGLLLGTPPGLLAARAVVPVTPTVLAVLLPPAIVAAGCLLAVWRPTQRACRTDPVEALREG
jgi:putative ABC transport system permease protein